MKYKRKPIEIEAVQLIKGCGAAFDKIFKKHIEIKIDDCGRLFANIETFYGRGTIIEGEYIVIGYTGDIVIMSEKELKERYEKV